MPNRCHRFGPNAPPPPSSGTMHFGANVSQAEDYTGNRNFININLDSSRDWWYPGTTNPWPVTDFGWPMNVPNGGSVSRILRFIDSANHALTPQFLETTGNYKVVCETGWTPSIETTGTNSYGVTQLTSGSGYCTFTVDVTDGMRITIRMTNNTGATSSITPDTFACFEAVHESAWNADHFAFLPAALVNYSGFSVLRFATTSTVNAQYNYPDAASIEPKAKFMGGSWPPEIQAKLAKETGAGMWLQLPTWIDRMNMSSYATADRIVRAPWPQVTGGEYRLSGTAGTITATTMVLPGGASIYDDFYNGQVLYVAEAATNQGQAVTVTDYVGSTGTITFASWPGGTPTGTVRVVMNPVAAPANGTQMIFITDAVSDVTTNTGLTQMTYVTLNADAYSFQLATLAAPSTPLNITVASDFSMSLTQYRDQESNWTTYIQRHFDEYPNPPSIQCGIYLECWNPGYLGYFICRSLGNYVRSGSLVGGSLADGHGELTLLGWSILESIYSPSICKRMVESGISAGNSGIMDTQDINALVSLNAPIGTLCKVLSIATYFAPWETAIPTLGTVDWYDAYWTTSNLVNAIYGGSPTMNESSNLSASAIASLWTSTGPFTGAQWADINRQFWHYLHIHGRLWRNKMAEHGKVIVTDYTMEAYECGNHMRIDRGGGYVSGDTTELIQTSYINWLFGSDSTAVAFRDEFLAALEYDKFTLAMHYHLLGDWFRTNTQVNQWGALAFHGAETAYTAHAHYYNFLKAHL